ncbi:hypothetical protein KBY85_15300 [Cyanobium sp. BA5m-10]|jgi:hypothetical protein|uniref:hypothetical protein n=1 Tax=Cyanobium sp. BA5m-10 TaxID=2823705 RepID=UPI0020CCF830|nr:hypothetical protein [Cyanobium sp. BA5m-10]MCP9905490.1 hypothetical protein [Cyanobium sp. BA5m-10]
MPEHDAAYPAVRRNYADIYCSDDREYCRIVDEGEQLPGSTDLTLPPVSRSQQLLAVLAVEQLSPHC